MSSSPPRRISPRSPRASVSQRMLCSEPMITYYPCTESIPSMTITYPVSYSESAASGAVHQYSTNSRQFCRAWALSFRLKRTARQLRSRHSRIPAQSAMPHHRTLNNIHRKGCPPCQAKGRTSHLAMSCQSSQSGIRIVSATALPG